MATSIPPGLPSLPPQTEPVTPVSPLGRAALISLTYLVLHFMLVVLSNALGITDESAWSLVAGLNLALVWVFGLPYMLIIFTAILLQSLWLYPIDSPWLVTITWGLFKALGFGLAAIVLRQWLYIDERLPGLRDVSGFVIVAFTVPPAVGALGQVILVVTGFLPWSHYLQRIGQQWMGDVLGIIVLAPVLLVHAIPYARRLGHGVRPAIAGTGRRSVELWQRLHRRQWLEFILFSASAALVFAFVFLYSMTRDILLLYPYFLPLIWIALRYGFKGTTVAVLLINVATVLTSASFSGTLSVVDLQLFMLTLSFTGLFLGMVVSERRRVTEQMGFQAQLLDSVRESIIATDLDGRVLYWSKGAAALYGYAAGEVMGQPITFIVPEEARNEEEARMIQVTETGMWSGQYTQRRRDGTSFRADTVISLIIDEAGRPQGFVGVDRDITYRRDMEEATRRYAEQLEALRQISLKLTAELDLDSLLHAIVSRAIELLNAASGGIYLYRPEQDALEWSVSINSHFIPFKPVLRRGEGVAGAVWEHGKPLIVHDYRTWPGRTIDYEEPLSSIGVPVQWGDDFLGVLDIVADASSFFSQADARLLSLFATQAAIAIQNARLYDQLRHHAAELEARVAERTQALAQANEQLKELDRLKSKFISDVSHELRTPVTNMALYLDLLELGRAEKHSAYVRILRDQSDRLRQLVENILNISRLEVNRDRLVFAPVDLNAVIAEVIQDQRLRAEVARLALSFEPDESLPPVRGEPERLALLVMNLVANAINYTAAGSVSVCTRLAAAPHRAGLIISDTGMGIDPADRPHLFERFYRGRRVSQLNVPGTGLGLAIVKEIVDLHGGDIEVQSQVDEGTVFTVWLPLWNGEVGDGQ